MTRLSLTLGHPDGDLVIPGQPDFGTVGHNGWVTKLTLPDRTWRRTYAPSSDTLGGQFLLSAVVNAAAITALVTIKAPTSVELGDQIAHLEEVASQFSYALTTITDTRTQVWSAEPADITYGDYIVGSDRMAAAQLVLSIPASATA